MTSCHPSYSKHRAPHDTVRRNCIGGICRTGRRESADAVRVAIREPAGVGGKRPLVEADEAERRLLNARLFCGHYVRWESSLSISRANNSRVGRLPGRTLKRQSIPCGKARSRAESSPRTWRFRRLRTVAFFETFALTTTANRGGARRVRKKEIRSASPRKPRPRRRTLLMSRSFDKRLSRTSITRRSIGAFLLRGGAESFFGRSKISSGSEIRGRAFSAVFWVGRFVSA